MQTLTPARFLALATLEGGVYWIEADGTVTGPGAAIREGDGPGQWWQAVIAIANGTAVSRVVPVPSRHAGRRKRLRLAGGAAC